MGEGVTQPKWIIKRWIKRGRVRFLLWRYGNRCYYCTCDFGLGSRTPTIDHRVAKSVGGDNKLNNLVLACRTCNNRKASLSEDEYRATSRFLQRLLTVTEERLRA